MTGIRYGFMGRIFFRGKLKLREFKILLSLLRSIAIKISCYTKWYGILIAVFCGTKKYLAKERLSLLRFFGHKEMKGK